ncbi:GntR family transcriptional regulator [Streptomyces sp. Ac-502]|uniref:GntR family transcriptional regulator n=1 Tax=Streptomyces sp. Ac-502 TaxID=3342801 RepID=UPI003862B7DB
MTCPTSVPSWWLVGVIGGCWLSLHGPQTARIDRRKPRSARQQPPAQAGGRGAIFPPPALPGVRSWEGRPPCRRRRERHVPQTSPRGTYLQITESLRQKIKKGKITESLPSEAELMRTYGVGRTTVGRALSVLRNEGVIESVQGVGWYVAGTRDRRPLVERMTDLLRAEDVTPGAPFPSEKELGEQFGMSRTAVRTAIAQLEGAGLVEMGPGRRRRVRALPPKEGTS